MSELGREPAPEDLDDGSGGFVVGGQRVGRQVMVNDEPYDVIEPGSFASDANDHLVSESDLVGLVSQGPLTVHAREVPPSPLELSRTLQERLREVRGGVGGKRAESATELTKRLRMNIEAMHVELAELLMELPWKEWKTYPDDFMTEDRELAIMEELIDLHFFLNNMYLAIGMDDKAIQTLYEFKFKKNMERQAEGGVYR